ncbi:hypothetical protein, partial [Salmonella enterica]|uniref:hypothetical protein n=1 Tax=Salmonella enterica TaxID=28901 RepID=UPI000BE2BA24
TPGIFLVLSDSATYILSVCICDAHQWVGAYGKTPAARPSSSSWHFALMFLLALSPDSVDNRLTVFE